MTGIVLCSVLAWLFTFALVLASGTFWIDRAPR